MKDSIYQITFIIKSFYDLILNYFKKIYIHRLNIWATELQWQKLHFFIILFLCSNSIFLSAASTPKLVDWHSTEGLKRFSQSQYKVDFPYLANQFQNQLDGLICGPTTGAIILNALKIGNKKAALPKVNFKEKYRKYLPKHRDPRVARYTPDSFMNQKAQVIKNWAQLYGQPINDVNDFGLQIRQLHKIFLTHGAKSKLRIVNKDLSDQRIKQEFLSNLSRRKDYVVINYKRSIIGQKGGGHISPLGAYDKKTDSFLIMDVNSSKYHWVWVKTKDIINAMRTFDTIENRGYLLITN